jgi:hypothetical protein
VHTFEDIERDALALRSQAVRAYLAQRRRIGRHA